jgi:prephenate dehydrogenase
MGISTSKSDPENFMSSAIIGFGAIGQALARAFARKNLQVAVAARRPPEAIAPQATAIGPTVTAHSLQDALRAEIALSIDRNPSPDLLRKSTSPKGEVNRRRRSSLISSCSEVE